SRLVALTEAPVVICTSASIPGVTDAATLTATFVSFARAASNVIRAAEATPVTSAQSGFQTPRAYADRIGSRKRLSSSSESSRRPLSASSQLLAELSLTSKPADALGRSGNSAEPAPAARNWYVVSLPDVRRKSSPGLPARALPARSPSSDF